MKKDNNQLDWRFHGLTDEHLDKEYLIDASYQRGFLSLKQKWKLRELIDALEKVYCKNIGIEYMHIMDYDECNWIREKFEEGYMDELPKEKKIQAYDRL